MTEREYEQLNLLGEKYAIAIHKDKIGWFINLSEYGGTGEFETEYNDTLQGAVDEAMEGVGL